MYIIRPRFFWLRFKGLSVAWLNIFHHIHLTTLFSWDDVIRTQLQIITAKFAKKNLSAVIPICPSTFRTVEHQIFFVQYVEQMYFYITGCDHYLTDQHRELWHQLGATYLAAKHRCYYCSYWHTRPHCLSFTFSLLTHSRNKMSATTNNYSTVIERNKRYSTLWNVSFKRATLLVMCMSSINKLLHHGYIPVEIILCKMFVCYASGMHAAVLLHVSRFYFWTTSVLSYDLPLIFWLLLVTIILLYILQCIHWNYVEALFITYIKTLCNLTLTLYKLGCQLTSSIKQSLTQWSLVWVRTSTPNPSLWF